MQFIRDRWRRKPIEVESRPMQRERMTFRTVYARDWRDRRITVTMPRVSLGCPNPGVRVIDWRSAG